MKKAVELKVVDYKDVVITKFMLIAKELRDGLHVSTRAGLRIGVAPYPIYHADLRILHLQGTDEYANSGGSYNVFLKDDDCGFDLLVCGIEELNERYAQGEKLILDSFKFIGGVNPHNLGSFLRYDSLDSLVGRYDTSASGSTRRSSRPLTFNCTLGSVEVTELMPSQDWFIRPVEGLEVAPNENAVVQIGTSSGRIEVERDTPRNRPERMSIPSRLRTQEENRRRRRR